MNIPKIIVFVSILSLCSCVNSQKKTEFEPIVQEWKSNLMKNKVVGPPCYEDVPKWISENPDLYHGMQEITSKITDFNKDGIKDGLFYFRGMNCLGIPTLDSDFALLVYSKNGEQIIDSLITSTIDGAITTSLETTYSAKIDRSKVFYEAFHKTIIGKFEAWTTSDTSCCASYAGTFEYDVNNSHLIFKDILIKENQ